MYGIKEAIQPYMSYVWFPRNIYGGHPGKYNTLQAVNSTQNKTTLKYSEKINHKLVCSPPLQCIKMMYKGGNRQNKGD